MGLVVWCVGDEGRCVPLRLDAIRLSGALTRPHLEAVSEFIRLAVAHRLVLSTSQQHVFHPPREPCADNNTENLATNSTLTNNISDSNHSNFSSSNVKDNNNNNENDNDSINNNFSTSKINDSNDKAGSSTSRHWCSKSQEKRLQRLREVWARNTRKLSTGSSSYCVFEDQK